jgi:hypothetical protein
VCIDGGAIDATADASRDAAAEGGESGDAAMIEAGSADACRAANCSLPTAAGSPAPTILNSSATAAPGDVISQQGAGFTGSAQVFLQPLAATASMKLQVLTGSTGHVAAVIPSTIMPGI